MPNATIHGPDKTCKPDDPVSIPAKIAPNWVHAGAVARAIVGRVERKMRTECGTMQIAGRGSIKR